MSPFIRLGLLALALHAAAPQSADAQSRAIPAVNTDQTGLAIKGIDPVAYFTVGAPVKGLPEHVATYEGATFRFASAANREAFVKEPAKYAPQFGGYCAMGVAFGAKYDIEPEAWRIVDGRLYLNKDRKTQTAWVRDIPGHVAKADAKWPAIRDRGFAAR